MLIVIIVFFENGSWAAAQHHLSFVELTGFGWLALLDLSRFERIRTL